MKTSHLQREELQREEESTLVNIFEKLRLQDAENYRKYLKVNGRNFQKIK